MALKIYHCEQGSEEWHQLRLGMVTASRFADATAGGQGKTRRKYMIELLAERLTGEPQDNFTNQYIERGIEMEAQALANYELETGNIVTRIGFAKLDDNIGCSPDGLVNDDGLVQVKCPKSTTHIEYILSDKAPSTYLKQILGELWIMDRDWNDFVSYDDRMQGHELFTEKIHRSFARPQIGNLVEEIHRFVDELIAEENKLHGDMEKLLRMSLENQSHKAA